MKVSIMQPNIFMWCGLLKQILDSDLHIVLDHVKASKNARYNRNLVQGLGKKAWLTIPFVDFSRQMPINKLILNTSLATKRKVCAQFESRYRKAPFYDRTSEILLDLFDNADSEQCPLVSVYSSFLTSLQKIGLKFPKIVSSSKLLSSYNMEFESFQGIDIVNSLLDHSLASTYLAAQNTVNYACISDYKINSVLIQSFNALPYSQQNLEGQNNFTPNLSCLDILCYLDIPDILLYLHNSNKWGVL